MAFILAAQRDADPISAFTRYQQYLAQFAAQFPPSAYQLATSTWYFHFEDHRCPHDAWLEQVSLHELASGQRQEQRALTLRLRLLNAYHSGYIELSYPIVFSYQLMLHDGINGHCDWRYDEFRIREQGGVVHEIEWASMNETARWVIEASDVKYAWYPT